MSCSRPDGGERPVGGLGREGEDVLVGGADRDCAPAAAPAPGPGDLGRREPQLGRRGADREDANRSGHAAMIRAMAEGPSRRQPFFGTYTPMPSGNARPVAHHLGRLRLAVDEADAPDRAVRTGADAVGRDHDADVGVVEGAVGTDAEAERRSRGEGLLAERLARGRLEHRAQELAVGVVLVDDPGEHARHVELAVRRARRSRLGVSSSFSGRDEQLLVDGGRSGAPGAVGAVASARGVVPTVGNGPV